MSAQHTAAPLIDRLRQRGMRITAQRRAVASVLHGANVHLTADEIFERARHELPEISRATVYNTIHELTRLGELFELSLDGRSKRYDPNVHPGHHHFVCRSCRAIHDVNLGQPAPSLDRDAHPGLHADTAQIVYGGLCAACR
jgi:Fur family transcriptional regulator, stress-responsive regulator